MADRPSNGRSRERGAALIEFALVLPIVVGLTFGVIDLGRAFFVRNVVEQAAREGSRKLALGFNQTVIESEVKSIVAAAGVDTSVANNVVVAFDDPWQNFQVRTTVTAKFNWLFPGLFKYFIPGFDPSNTNITSACIFRTEHT